MEERLHLSTHGVMLTMDAPPRRAVTKTTTTNGAARKPSSSSASSSSPFSFSTSSLNTNSHRVAMHSSHPHPHPHQQQKRYQQPYDFKVHHHLLSDECPQDAALRKNLPPLQYKVHDSAFCRVLSAETTAVALAAAAICSSDIDRDIWKCGYLRKQKHGHKRFFVLRGPSNLGPSRLEYYDSEKKFRSALKAAASGVVCPAKRVIYLSQCFTVNKRADAKNKYLIALYTKDEYFAVAAESEQEQEDWYFCLTELMTEGKKGQLESDELDDGYGTISPGTIFKEVWQVNVKPKGLGQTKNLMGVYRLCLSAKTIHLVKLNSETPAVNLPLMSIRRCGHSESFFFIEVGRSSSIGPGEIWVQVDDSVVAQNMHETILDTMKALKAFPDFRPRSKSQSSGLNPIPFVTTRRHFCNLPPSQTGLQRPYRTDSVTGMAPTSKSKSRTSQRYRTSSEGEGAQNRPLSSGTGSLVHLITPVLSVGREESGSVCANISPASSHHTRSASLPVSHFLSATSPISVSSSSGHGSASDTHTRPSSSSICGSPSDGGFNSSDEFCPSPCDFRYFHASCTTPDSHSSTPPVREDYRLTEYMAMDWHKDGIRTFEEESGYMERTFLKLAHSSKPSMGSSLGFMQQKATQTSSSLDEPSPVDSKQHQVCLCLLKSAYKSYSELHHPNTPHLLSSECQKKLLDDDGYVPMLYSTAPAANADYISMQPRVNHPASLDVHPCSSQQSDKYGYMMMLPGDSSSSRDQAEYDDYMDMSQFSAAEDFAQDSPEGHKTHGSYFSLPRSYKTPSREQREKTEYSVLSPTESHSPHSPGKYIQVDFGEPSPHSAASPPSENSPSPSPPPAQSCHQSCCALPDHSYLGLNMDDLLKDRPPRHSFVAPWNPPNYGRSSGCYSQASTNFEPEKMYSGHRDTSSPRRMMQHLCISERLPPGAHAETRVVRADSQGRRRHSSETFAASPGTFAGGCSIKSLDSQKVPETSSWQNSASFDSTWSYPNTSPDSPNLAMNSTAGGTRQNSSSSYLNYIALDLREVPRVPHSIPPAQAPRSNLQEREGYVSMDFSMSVERATASKD